MSFDLTNKNIQDTFQNLLQKTGSDGRLHDLVGNQVDDLTLTNISASGHISASKFRLYLFLFLTYTYLIHQ